MGVGGGCAIYFKVLKNFFGWLPIVEKRTKLLILSFLGAGSISTLIFPVVNYECLWRKKKGRLRPLINLFWSGFWLKMPMALIQLSVWQDIRDDLENKTNCLKDSFFVNKGASLESSSLFFFQTKKRWGVKHLLSISSTCLLVCYNCCA